MIFISIASVELDLLQTKEAGLEKPDTKSVTDRRKDGHTNINVICDVICKKVPCCGTNIVGPGQTLRMMRGV